MKTLARSLLIVGLVSLAADATFAVALAQSQGPLTTVPWAARSRAKPNPEVPGTDASDQNVLLPAPAGKPVDAAPEPPKARTADR